MKHVFTHMLYHREDHAHTWVSDIIPLPDSVDYMCQVTDEYTMFVYAFPSRLEAVEKRRSFIKHGALGQNI